MQSRPNWSIAFFSEMRASRCPSCRRSSTPSRIAIAICSTIWSVSFAKNERRWNARRTDDGSRLRSEEHTSELQSRVDLVCRLLLEKKKKRQTEKNSTGNNSHKRQQPDKKHLYYTATCRKRRAMTELPKAAQYNDTVKLDAVGTGV